MFGNTKIPFENINPLQEKTISKLELQADFLESPIFFLKYVYTRDLKLRFGQFLLGLCNPNLV